MCFHFLSEIKRLIAFTNNIFVFLNFFYWFTLTHQFRKSFHKFRCFYLYIERWTWCHTASVHQAFWRFSIIIFSLFSYSKFIESRSSEESSVFKKIGNHVNSQMNQFLSYFKKMLFFFHQRQHRASLKNIRNFVAR